jgi:hypothetical protein
VIAISNSAHTGEHEASTCQLLPQLGGGHAPPAIEQAITVRTIGSLAGRDDHSSWPCEDIWSCAQLYRSSTSTAGDGVTMTQWLAGATDDQQRPFNRTGEHAESAAKQGGTVPFQFGFRRAHSRGGATHQHHAGPAPSPTSAATHPIVIRRAYAR